MRKIEAVIKTFGCNDSGTGFGFGSLPASKIAIAPDDALVERAVHAIRDAARTDEIGDGKILVLPVEQAIRIRTGEQGHVVL
jgi:nitrogen regulatory protein PII